MCKNRILKEPKQLKPPAGQARGGTKMKKISASVILLLAVCFIYGSNNKNKDYIQWWTATYGDYADGAGKTDWRVKEAKAVFERVSAAADKVSSFIPRLFIIGSEGEPLALALPDGNIIINKKTLDICCGKDNSIQGNPRMAFILGHELAHLANKDFMHREAFLALQQYGSEKANQMIAKHFNLSDREKAKECRIKELMADKLGVLYASMAGYDIGSLCNKEDDFFSSWVNQIGVRNFYNADNNYPTWQERLEFIRTQLAAVIKNIELFRAGVLLYQKGSSFDAAASFIEFSKAYPGREVFNNIGACHFDIALRRLSTIAKTEYYRFRLSTTIDYTSNAESIARFKGGENYLNDTTFSQHINNAEKYFNFAVEKDSENKTSRWNLSAVLILKGEYAAAQAHCDHILKTHPKDVNALNNKAIAFYYYGQKNNLDTTQLSIRLLQQANKEDPNNFEVLYNLASLKEQRERMAGAKHYWEKYLNLTPPKDNFYYYVCRKLNRNGSDRIRKHAKPPQLKDLSGIKIKIGDDQSQLEKEPGNENLIKFKIGSEDKGSVLIEMAVLVKNNLRVLALDELIEMMEWRITPGKSVQEMLDRLGEPGQILRHTNGNFYVYKNKGFSFKEINGKVRSYIWFEKD